VRILVTGGAGMLGSSLCPTLVGLGHEVVTTDIRLLSPEIEFLDVRDRTEVGRAVERVAPDVVMHLAAETDLEICEGDVELAYLTNTVGTKNVATVCRDRDLPLVYISTIGVFDGTKETPYDENDVANPINVYGRTKWGGELLVEALVEKHFIVRAGWMIGGGDREKKFVSLIIRQIREGARTLQVVTDKLGTPTYSVDFAKGLAWLIASQHYGTYNLSSGASVSRYDVARLILRVLGREDVELIPILSDSAYIKEQFPTPRPRSEIMRSLKAAALGLNCMRPWDEALEEYLRTSYRNDIMAPGRGETA
jgi:dTDP-4-dehydrorhamnose reductase